MIGLDTNVLVRHIVQDNKEEARAASGLIASRCSADDPGVVSLVVLCELVWVLDRGYGYDRGTIATVLRQLLSVGDLLLDRSELAWQALHLYENGKADFADYLIGLSHRDQGAEVTCTFDRRASGCDLFELI
ncbi:MAG: type II toxin-antitoxin system VapC family toxin [Acidobacteriota bacterium]|jgi:predicted nucleic-acid-binding protein